MPNHLDSIVRPGLAPKEHENTRLVALSFDGPASPAVTLKGLDRSPRGQPYGWGFAWYPLQSAAALVVKDATSIGDNAMTKLLRQWERFQSTLFVSHLRGAARALTEQDTHPFSRSFGGREWVFAHNGDLDAVTGERSLREALPLSDEASIWPVGRTDSERAFCWLLEQCRTAGVRSLAEAGWNRLLGWFRRLDELGTTNLILTDGRDLAVYGDGAGYNRLHFQRLVPPDVPEVLRTADVDIGLQDAHDRHRTVIAFCTEPPEGCAFEPMADGQLLVVRRGAFIFDSLGSARIIVAPLLPDDASSFLASPEQSPIAAQASASGSDPAAPAGGDNRPASPPPAEPPAPVSAPQVPEPGDPTVVSIAPAPTPPPWPVHFFARSEGRGRLMSVEHVTTYTYSKPVERSTHLLRLQPVHDRWQDLMDFQLTVSVGGVQRRYDDVFGNAVVRVAIEQPFDRLEVRSRSLVRTRGVVPYDLQSPQRRSSIPLVWMPWQRQMMTPYLLPPELPETQLQELIDFAMSFVERQDYDLVQTLVDMNTTIYRDFKYVSGSTTMATTPFDVFVHRQGVCQDFANLLICLARLLNVPARYRVGYIYTGTDYENTVQSDASHAWAELYLPWSGWQGFDPTNGVMVNTDHVRVACGRNYGDATPTSGTIYKGGDGEKLDVAVRVDELESDVQP